MVVDDELKFEIIVLRLNKWLQNSWRASYYNLALKLDTFDSNDNIKFD